MVTKDGNIYVKNLQVHFMLNNDMIKIIDGIDIVFEAGVFTAIIGESGCGKSVLGQAILGILPQYVHKDGEIVYKNVDILKNAKAVKGFYGREFSIVPQNPENSLNPVRKICKQMHDILLAGEIEDKNDVYKIKCLKFFGIDEPDRVLESYPHELSGGMQQRVLCAMSISCKPKWILADEPTKGMDERLCGVVYDNLLSIKQNSPSSMIIITHDLKLAAQVCDKIAVMYAGQILEINSDLLKKPKHPYSQLFLKSLPENGLNTMQGISPVLGEKIQGCKFAPRCPYCMPICKNNMPDYYIEENVRVRCFLYA